MSDIPTDDSPRRDDDFPLDDTYGDDQDTPRRICPFCSSVDLDEYDDDTWQCLACGRIFQEDEPDGW
jgi:hypothetical protein